MLVAPLQATHRREGRLCLYPWPSKRLAPPPHNRGVQTFFPPRATYRKIGRCRGHFIKHTKISQSRSSILFLYYCFVLEKLQPEQLSIRQIVQDFTRFWGGGEPVTREKISASALTSSRISSHHAEPKQEQSVIRRPFLKQFLGNHSRDISTIWASTQSRKWRKPFLLVKIIVFIHHSVMKRNLVTYLYFAHLEKQYSI